MKVEVYTLAYNEEHLMPYFIKHYRALFPDAVIKVYDNYSTDRTATIARAAGCEVYKFSTNNEVRVDLLMQWRNNIWKGSDADWVIIPDTDEFIQITPADLCRSRLDNIFRCYAYQMVGDSMDIDSIKYGARTGDGFDRTCIFKPQEIKDINWDMGAHNSQPQAFKCLIWSSLRPLLFHMKYFSKQYLIDRNKGLGMRLSAVDHKNRWSYHYRWGKSQLDKVFADMEAKKVLVRA